MSDAIVFMICKTRHGILTHAKFINSFATLCGRRPYRGFGVVISLSEIECERCYYTLGTFMEAEAKVSGKMP